MSRPKGSKNKSTLEKEKVADELFQKKKSVKKTPAKKKAPAKKAPVRKKAPVKKAPVKKKTPAKKQPVQADSLNSMTSKTKLPKRKVSKSRKPKSIFKKNGFSIITLPFYHVTQIPKAIKTRSYVIESAGREKTIMVYIHIMDNFFRNCKTDEYLLFVKENNEGLGVFIRTGYKAGEFTVSKALLLEWEKAFFALMKTDSNFVRY